MSTAFIPSCKRLTRLKKPYKIKNIIQILFAAKTSPVEVEEGSPDGNPGERWRRRSEGGLRQGTAREAGPGQQRFLPRRDD